MLDGCPDALAVGIGDGDGAVVALDGCLDGIDALGALEAFAALVAKAHEILIGPGVAGVGQLPPAGSAEQAALEVVSVYGDLMGCVRML